MNFKKINQYVRGVWSVAILLLSSIFAYSQEKNEVVMRVGNREVTYSEFKEHRNFDSQAVEQTDWLYAYHWADRLLKSQQARMMQLDTLPQVHHWVDSCMAVLGEKYLNDSLWLNVSMQNLYADSDSQPAVKKKILRLYKHLPQNITRLSLQRQEILWDSLSSYLQKGAEMSFLVKQYSDVKKPEWVVRTDLPFELVCLLDSMKVGEISKPVYTPEGLHIVQLLEVDSIFPSEKRYNARLQQVRLLSLKNGTHVWSKMLKAQHRLLLNRDVIQSFLLKGKSKQVLFTLDGREYRQEDFFRFWEGHPGGLRRQWNIYLERVSLEAVWKKCLVENQMAQQQRVWIEEDFLAEMLDARMEAEEVTEQEMDNFFLKHRKDYRWEQPRYQGAVIHAVNKKVAKKVRKFLKKLPQSEWEEAVRLAVNQEKVQVWLEKKIFKIGDNFYVDREIFKRTTSSVPKADNFPYVLLLGEKLKEPDDYRMIKERLIIDYKKDKKERWMKHLRASIGIEIDDEALKTVNNHVRKN